MRFAVPDSDEEDRHYGIYVSDSSDEDYPACSKPRRKPRTNIGRSLQHIVRYSSSDGEVDDDVKQEAESSSDEEGTANEAVVKPGGYRETRTQLKRRMLSNVPPGLGSIGTARVMLPGLRMPPYSKSPISISTSTTPRRPRQSRLHAMLDAVDEDQSGYDTWLKLTEQSVWKEGHRIAHSRRTHLREVALNARDEVRAKQAAEAAQEAEDMRKLLEGMSIKVAQDEEAARQVFKEREKKLWEDIDAAIARAESLAAEKAALAAATEKKRLESARLAAEAEAKAKADAEAAALAAEKREAEAKQAAAVEAARKLQEEQALAEAREAEEKANRERNKTGAEWAKWVEVQRWMKKEVIEPIKADAATRRGLRVAMRGVTRGLGQVVNTRESIVRVTNEIHQTLIPLLPQPPSPASPATLTITSPPTLPLTYLYLLSHISKGLIKQAATEVSAKQDAAFPLARIVLGLLLRGHAALGEVLMARLVKKCPLVVPFYPTRQQGQSREEFDKSLGRALDESPADYVSRTTGIAALYFSILITPLYSFISPSPSFPSHSSLHPSPLPTPLQLAHLVNPALRLPAAWSWLANALKPPIPSLLPAAQLLTTWVEICASDVAQTYGQKQLDKVMRVIAKEGVGEQGEDGKYNGMVKGDSTAAVQRLGVAVGGWKARGAPEGRDWAEA